MQFKSTITVFLLALPAVFALPSEVLPRVLDKQCTTGLDKASIKMMQQLNAGAYKKCLDLCDKSATEAGWSAQQVATCKACCEQFREDGKDWKSEAKNAQTNKVKTSKPQ